MRIVLCAVEPALANAWEAFCGDLEGVSIHPGSILDVTCNAVVSPANSFGFMDGGIDMLYTRHFGEVVEARVRRQILERHHGELVVGQADIVETGNDAIPFLIAAPTMRVPMALDPLTVNPYLAARATLLLVMHGTFTAGPDSGKRISERVKTIAFPGLGTGVGRVSFPTCAIQMKRAIEDTVLGKYRMPRSWAEASERHQLLYTDKPKRLQV
jgi:O-acetyl-ADP-ribose deacetylase (regulator of RNase III)